MEATPHQVTTPIVNENVNPAKIKLKTMKLSRVSTGGALGLLDSGATHPLRGMTSDEKN